MITFTDRPQERAWADEFINTMNPEHITGESANFGTYTIRLNDEYNLELYFVMEEYDNEVEYNTAIDLCDSDCRYIDYTYARGMTDAQSVADGIAYLIDKWEVEV